MSIWDFADSPESMRAIADAALLSSALLSGSREWRSRPRPLPFAAEFGVFGAGIVRYRNGLAPFLLVNRDQAPAREIVPLLETRGPRAACEILFGRGLEAMSRTMAMGIETPVAQMSPGDDVSTAISGAGGIQISWSGKQGILTAGHVGTPAGATVYSAGTKIGKVVLSLDPATPGLASQASGLMCAVCGLVCRAQVANLNPQPDVAIIDLAPGIQINSPISKTTTARPGDKVDIPTPRGALSAQIMGLMTWLWMPGTAGTYGEVYITTNQVTQPGDSGSPALLNGDLIGHVVGGSPGCTTFVQDFDYQIAHIRAQAGFASATI